MNTKNLLSIEEKNKFKNYIENILEKKTLYGEDLYDVLIIWSYISKGMGVELRLFEYNYKGANFVYFVKSGDKKLYSMLLDNWNENKNIGVREVYYWVLENERIRRILEVFLNVVDTL